MDYNHQCIICTKEINFGKPLINGDEVVMFNYIHPTSLQNSVLVFCSKYCREKKAIGCVHCVSCKGICFTDTWFLHVKFLKLGGWTSIRSCCSEKCQNNIIKNETTDIEFCYTCWSCRKPSEKKLKKCGKCHLAYYCDDTCQKKHWPEHKKTCN